MSHKTADRLYLLLVLLVLAALPSGVSAYNGYTLRKQVPDKARTFLLTGHRQRGWILGSVTAKDIVKESLASMPQDSPVILRVHKGDTVVLRLTSSDVVHGFSLKDFGVFVNNGIQPGKPQLVKFVADKVGRFQFACNTICGKHHEKMVGTLIVEG